MDSLFVEGVAATVSAIIVFCGSVWLLLALVLGPRLAYFVTASITLGFLLLMGGVWSYGEPLGPVGELPSYQSLGAAETAAELPFGPAAEYPEGDWFVPSEDDDAALDIKTGAEGAATGALEDAIEAEEVTAFASASQASVDAEATRLLLDGDGTYYAVVRVEPIPTVEEEGDAPTDQDIAPEEGDTPAEDDAAAEAEETGPAEDAEAFVVLEQHPGNPSGDARMLTLGVFVLLVLHLVGLSFSEKRARSQASANA